MKNILKKISTVAFVAFVVGGVLCVSYLFVSMLENADCVGTFYIVESAHQYKDLKVIDDTDTYIKPPFAKKYIYPKLININCTKKNDKSIRLVFKDKLVVDIDTSTRLSLPVKEKERLLLHGKYRNISQVREDVSSYISKCYRMTAQQMTSKEFAKHRNSFMDAVSDQLKNGIYDFDKVTARDIISGKTILTWHSKMLDDDNYEPARLIKSPLTEDGFGIILLGLRNVNVVSGIH